MFGAQLDLVSQTMAHGVTGRVATATGLTVTASGFPVPVGAMCWVSTRSRQRIAAQVVGFREGKTILMPLADAMGVARGDPVEAASSLQRVGVGPELLGRIVDGLAEPIDGKGPLRVAEHYPVFRAAPEALSRQPIDRPLGTGVRSLDAILTAGGGQRLGIFAGTGLGKSILLGMIARYTSADVIVLALVGERGREVGDFLARDLGEQGLKRSVVVVSTSDQSPVLRVRACFVATAIAEYFRDQGQTVLLLMDSITRMAMAQRQIGLAAGEPPATKGYTPSVFALLPQLVERSGRTDRGSITGFYTVLVEGDDINEPISDAVRGILDGHVWLSRALANRGHYPAVDVLGSISRVMIDIVDDEHYAAARNVQRVLATWQEIEDLVNIGAYAAGTNPEFDLAVQARPMIDTFLQQAIEQRVEFDQARSQLLELNGELEQIRRRLEGNGKQQPAVARPA